MTTNNEHPLQEGEIPENSFEGHMERMQEEMGNLKEQVRDKTEAAIDYHDRMIATAKYLGQANAEIAALTKSKEDLGWELLQWNERLIQMKKERDDALAELTISRKQRDQARESLQKMIDVADGYRKGADEYRKVLEEYAATELREAAIAVLNKCKS